jgi:hypothetical protein
MNTDVLGARTSIFEFETGDIPLCFIPTVEGDFGVSAPFTKDHQRGVNRNPGEPRLETRSSLESVERFVHAQERILQGVFGILSVLGNGKELSINSWRTDLSELGKRSG